MALLYHKVPRIIHSIAFWYLVPIILLVCLWGFDTGFLNTFLILLILAVYATLILLTIYRPTKINRWFPITMPIISIVGLVLFAMSSDDGLGVAFAILGIISTVTLPTLIGTILLLAIPSARRYFFNHMPIVSQPEIEIEPLCPETPSSSENNGKEN